MIGFSKHKNAAISKEKSHMHTGSVYQVLGELKRIKYLAELIA